MLEYFPCQASRSIKMCLTKGQRNQVLGSILLIANAWAFLSTHPLGSHRTVVVTSCTLVHQQSISKRFSQSPLFSAQVEGGEGGVITESSDHVDIEGLDWNTIERWNRMHLLLRELQQQIPVLLTVPLAVQSAKRAYSEDVRLLVGEDDVELASSRDELINLSQLFDLLLSASTRASSLWSSSSSKDKRAKGTTSPTIQCRLGVNTYLTEIRVEWEVDLAAPLGVASFSSTVGAAKLQGNSLLEVDPDTQIISTHRLLQVQWNGQEQDASSIGRFLSNSRQAVLSLRQAPFLQPLLSSPILTQVRDELIQQQQQQLASGTNSNQEQVSPSIFVVTTSSNETNATSSSPFWVAVDDFDSPFPGSLRWPAHVARQQAVIKFCKEIIPMLSGQTSVPLLKSYFVPQARLYATDGSLLLQDNTRLANFYHSLAAWRERSFGSWSLERVKALDNNDPVDDIKKGTARPPRIQIEYRTSNQIPGAGAPLQARGRDIYTLDPIDPKDPGRLLIAKVQQTKFSIGEQDGIWLMRSLAAAVETGRFRADDSSFLIDLVNRFSQEQKGQSKTKTNRDQASVPKTTDRAAVVAYRIMESLHVQLRSLVDPASGFNTPAVSDFMSDNVKLLGYLEETLLRGQSAYNRNVGLAMASLRAGIQTGGILSEKEPTVGVELTRQGKVRCSLILHLKLKSPIVGLPGMVDLNGAGLPLQLGFVSEYSLCPETGEILKHRLLESRVNGQLTPGDVVSRWIQRFASGAYTIRSGEDDTVSDDT